MTVIDRNMHRFRRVLNDQELVDFVKAVRLGFFSTSTTRDRAKVKNFFEEAFELLTDTTGNPRVFKKTVQRISSELFNKHPGGALIRKHNAHYAKHVKAALEVDAVRKFISGSTLLDVGCGGGHLSLALSKEGYEVLKTDVLDWRIDEVSHLPFRRMPDPATIPYPDKSADTGLVHMVLHHVDSHDLKRLLSQLRRVCKRVIVREDVYGVSATRRQFKEVFNNDELLSKFSKFSNQEQRAILVFYDYWFNAVENGVAEMNFPFEFKTIEAWENLFSINGFEVRKTVLIGFRRGRDYAGICHALFVLDSLP
ncbi:MAG: methyltransferase domain-containing protein [Pseudomonadota bacterium]